MNKKFKKWFRRIAILVCLIVFVYSAVQLGLTFYYSHQQKEIKKEVQLVVKVPENIEEKKNFTVDWKKLLEINPDIVGYILIPNTNISYPIVYKKGDTNYYLRRDIKGNYSAPGSIFMDGDASPNFSDRHTFIYGHNQRDLTMFGDIRNFLKKEFFDSHPYAYIFTPTQNYRLEVIGVETSKVNGEAYETVGLNTDEQVQTYINNIYKNAKFSRNVNVSAKDSIVSLSTCGVDDIKTTRDILHLKLTKWDGQ